MQDDIRVFDRRLVRRRRERAAAGLAAHDFLFREAADRLADRLLDVRRDFRRILDLGARSGHLARALAPRDGVDLYVATDLAAPMLAAGGAGPRVAADEEALPFADASFDLVMSSLSLHWVNDLPGALIQIRRALRPDGLFLAALLGGDTLNELRTALVEAELDVSGGAAARVSPFADVRDAGGLMQRAGFALPVVDSDTVTVTYPDALALMRDLRGMGEGNAVADSPRRFRSREVPARAAAIYRDRFGDGEGRVPATFQFVYLTGWAPDPENQPKPLRPGQAAGRLAQALDAEEQPAGDRTPIRRD